MNFIYENQYTEIGNEIKSTNVSDTEQKKADTENCDLLYGELLETGLQKVLDEKHLNIASAEIICDLGMGSGKIPIRLFAEYPRLKRIYGIEFSSERYQQAKLALIKLATKKKFYQNVTDNKIQIKDGKREIILLQGNMFENQKWLIEFADIVFINVEFDKEEPIYSLHELTKQIKGGGRIMSYMNLKTKFQEYELNHDHLQQLEVNKSESDTFFTSWAPKGGYHFYLFRKLKRHEIRVKI
jgi:precorrin-6B methylase 2